MPALFLILIYFFTFGCKVDTPENIKKDVPVTHDKKTPIVFDVIMIRSFPKLGTFWPAEMPEFVFCKSSGISRERANQGVFYWKNLGYPIINVRYIEDGPECRNINTYGKIIIKLIDNTVPINSNLSVTQVSFYRDSKQIQSATIYLISAYADKPRLIEHEIGHALGWKHYNRRNHVMNPEYSRTGFDYEGLEYVEYQKQSIDFFKN